VRFLPARNSARTRVTDRGLCLHEAADRTDRAYAGAQRTGL